MLAIRVDEQIAKELDLIAGARGTSRSALVRETIMQYLKNNEDLDLAKDAQQRTIKNAW